MGTITTLLLALILNISSVFDPTGNKSIEDSNTQKSITNNTTNSLVFDPTGN